MKMLLTLCILVLSPSLWGFDLTHQKLSEILRDFTTTRDGQTWVHYGKLARSGRTALTSYLKDLSSVKESQFNSWTPDERLAFLINAYNAFTLEWILLHPGIKSIKDTGSFFKSPWKKEFPKYKLLGDEFTLDEIEHGMIRKDFREPRIHFAVNCASLGCPSLRRSAYTGKILDSELGEAEKEFFGNPRKYRRENDTVKLNPILDWYGSDFRNVHGSVEAYLKKNDPTLPTEFRISWLDYDWKLNGDWE